MASEQRDESPRLCANGCGFFGRPETRSMCSKCCRLDELKKQAASVAAAAASAASAELDAAAEKLVNAGSLSADTAATAAPLDGGVKPEEGSNGGGKSKDRCGWCNKRVGLAKGFRCRCGNMYCPAHRYPEEHGCTFDFKAAGRDSLAKSNPVVKADKLQRRL